LKRPAGRRNFLFDQKVSIDLSLNVTTLDRSIYFENRTLQRGFGELDNRTR